MSKLEDSLEVIRKRLDGDCVSERLHLCGDYFQRKLRNRFPHRSRSSAPLFLFSSAATPGIHDNSVHVASLVFIPWPNAPPTLSLPTASHGARFAEMERTMDDSGIIVHLDMASFPAGHGPNKVITYPDVRLLAEVAEEEGIDLRVVYLQRSARDMLISDTVHRSFLE